MMHNIFADKLTKEDEERGFKIIAMESEYGMEPPVKIVALKLSDSDYLFKTPEGKYKHMRYGYVQMSKTKTPDWMAVGDVLYDSADISAGEIVVEKEGPLKSVSVPFKSLD